LGCAYCTRYSTGEEKKKYRSKRQIARSGSCGLHSKGLDKKGKKYLRKVTLYDFTSNLIRDILRVKIHRQESSGIISGRMEKESLGETPPTPQKQTQKKTKKPKTAKKKKKKKTTVPTQTTKNKTTPNPPHNPGQPTHNTTPKKNNSMQQEKEKRERYDRKTITNSGARLLLKRSRALEKKSPETEKSQGGARLR